MATMGRHIAARAAGRQVRFVRPVPVQTAGPLAVAVASAVEREVKLLVPPLLAHTPAPQLLAACWVLIRETVFATGATERRVKEAAAAVVSQANSCPYCVEMHALGVRGLGSVADADAISANNLDEVGDEELRQILIWVRDLHRADAVPVPPALTPEQRAELLGVAVAFHYLTRMVNIFLPNYLLPPALRGGTRRMVKNRVAGLLGPMLRRPCTPGECLALLPDADPQPDAAWASASPHIAAAIARASDTVDRAGAAVLSPAVRDLLQSRLAEWDGEPLGASRDWLAPATAGLSPADRPAARLVLLTAFASYQVIANDADEFRTAIIGGESAADAGAGDEAMIAATAWASLTSARHVVARYSSR